MNKVSLYFVVLFLLFSLSSCCTLKKDSNICRCKQYTEFVKNHWHHSSETGRNYIDSEYANQSFQSLEDFEKLADCWIGKTPEEIKKILPLPVIGKSTKDGYEFEQSRKIHDCKFKLINCDPIYNSAMAIHINFKLKGKVKRFHVHPSTTHGGGVINIDLYDFDTEDLIKSKGKK